MIVSANVIRLGIQFTFPGALLHEIGVFYDFQKKLKKNCTPSKDNFKEVARSWPKLAQCMKENTCRNR